VALAGIAAGEPILRYGEVIGYASRAIRRGSWVREELVTLPEPPALDRLPLATAVPPPAPPLEGFTFEGFRNADGSVGTRNLLGIATSVQCVAPTVEYAVKRIEAELLPRYQTVDGVAVVTHTYGCGVAIDAPGAAIPILTLRNIIHHPNLGGEPLLVSLGCEKLQPARLGEGFEIVRLQDAEHRGFEEMVAAILRLAERRLEQLNTRRRVPCPASDLVVGLQCGGSDAF
jgi:galactarate dehydratase